MNNKIHTVVLYSSSNNKNITARNTTRVKGFITAESKRAIIKLGKFINRK